MSWSDEELDKLFKDSAEKLSFEFKPEFLDEFEAMQESAIEGAVGTNDEVDMLYQQSASELSFEYKDAYWQEMQNFLPRRRQPDFLWWGTAILFIAAFITNIGVQSFSETSIETSLNTDAQDKNTGQVEATNSQNDLSSSNTSQLTEEHTTDFGTQDDLGIVNQSEIESRYQSDDIGSRQDLLNSSVTVDVIDTDFPELINEEYKVDVNEIPSEDKTIIDDKVNSLSVVSLEMDVDKEMNELNHEVPSMELDLPVAMNYFVELNGGLSQSMTTPSDRISSNIGLGLGFQLNKGKYSLLTSVYGQISDHNDLVLNKEAKVYGFGSQLYRYTLKYSQLYTLEANVSLGYRLGRHQMFVGIRPSYVMGTKVGVTLMEEEVQMDRQTVYGHFTGINRFGLKPSIGYSYDLPRNYTLGFNIGIQTMNVVDEQFINGVNRTLPVDGQIFLRKSINFRK